MMCVFYKFQCEIQIMMCALRNCLSVKTIDESIQFPNNTHKRFSLWEMLRFYTVWCINCAFSYSILLSGKWYLGGTSCDGTVYYVQGRKNAPKARMSYILFPHSITLHQRLPVPDLSHPNYDVIFSIESLYIFVSREQIVILVNKHLKQQYSKLEVIRIIA